MNYRIGGLSFLSRSTDGSIMLASYHPRRSPTWHWSVSLTRGGIAHRATRRHGQWHDFYWLPFGWRLLVSQQDYHKARPAAN